MKIKLVEKGNPSNPSAPKKWYANPVNAGKFTIRDFAKEIAGRSSLSRGDIENVLANFLDELPVFLKIGMSVQLGNFGTLRLSLSSEGAEKPEKFNTALIKNQRIIFTPSVELKNTLKDNIFVLVEMSDSYGYDIESGDLKYISDNFFSDKLTFDFLCKFVRLTNTTLNSLLGFK